MGAHIISLQISQITSLSGEFSWGHGVLVHSGPSVPGVVVFVLVVPVPIVLVPVDPVTVVAVPFIPVAVIPVVPVVPVPAVLVPVVPVTHTVLLYSFSLSHQS